MHTYFAKVSVADFQGVNSELIKNIIEEINLPTTIMNQIDLICSNYVF